VFERLPSGRFSDRRHTGGHDKTITNPSGGPGTGTQRLDRDIVASGGKYQGLDSRWTHHAPTLAARSRRTTSSTEPTERGALRHHRPDRPHAVVHDGVERHGQRSPLVPRPQPRRNRRRHHDRVSIDSDACARSRSTFATCTKRRKTH
jgi:hypothetical protein